MSWIVQALIDAMSIGSIYALTALGIGLIFGIMRLINFAHAEFITVTRAARCCWRCCPSGWPSVPCAGPIPRPS